MGILAALRRLERRTRPVDPEYARALGRRWADLPDHVRTPAQVLGRHAVGCEGTHGVFPRCDLACTPCYHSRDANRVRVDGGHTLTAVEAQMRLLRQVRGPKAHAQLIGGEVTLLEPEDHAAALSAMRAAGREPMSMSHGDIDASYLEALAIDAQGRRRFERLSFAGHFDMLMFGRRGIPRPADEQALNPYRQRFVDLFVALRRRHGVRFFLAHNMTVTPANVGQVADVVRDCHAMGFGMFSFQPAAFVGDERRWHEDYARTGMDEVWAQVERGVGTRLDHTVVQHGDLRCNRAAYGFYVGERWTPYLDGDDPRDLAARDAFFRWLGPFTFTGDPLPLLAARLLRQILRHPRIVTVAAGCAARITSRAGGPVVLARQALRGRVRSVSFVVHQFMDAADVAPAWDLMRRGEQATQPRLRATQERLAACHYAMAHPETGEIVPACVQHSVLDPAENVALRRLLPIIATR